MMKNLYVHQLRKLTFCYSGSGDRHAHSVHREHHIYHEEHPGFAYRAAVRAPRDNKHRVPYARHRQICQTP